MNIVEIYDVVVDLRKMIENAGSAESRIAKVLLEGAECEKYIDALSWVEEYLKSTAISMGEDAPEECIIV